MKFPSISSFFRRKKLQHPPEKSAFGKISGFSMEEVLTDWVKDNFGNEVVIILYEISPQARPTTFWRSLNIDDAIKFTKEVVVLKPKDFTEASRICMNLTEDFAKTMIFVNGEVKGIFDDLYSR